METLEGMGYGWFFRRGTQKFFIKVLPANLPECSIVDCDVYAARFELVDSELTTAEIKMLEGKQREKEHEIGSSDTEDSVRTKLLILLPNFPYHHKLYICLVSASDTVMVHFGIL